MSDYSEKQKLGIEQTTDEKAQGKGHDVLFRTISELAVRAMQRGRTREGALALVSEAFRFADQIIEDYELKEPLVEPVACKVGCYYCCYYEVVLTPAEALFLGNYVKQTYSEGALADLMNRIDRTLRLRDGRDVEERAKVLHDTPCMFLASGKCSVYDVRPFACRTLHALDGRKCKEAVMARRRVVEFTGYTHRYYIFQTAKAALRQFCEQMGCQTTELTIAKAMKQYLERPGCTMAWIRGGKVFKVQSESLMRHIR
jgi:Fe-S-cluster containining protein